MEAYKELCRLHLEKQKNFSYPVKYRYKPDSANGLTRCIKDYINLIGGFARRINTIGQWVQPKAKEGIIQKGYYRKASSTKGESDISFVYKGKSFAVEVKWNKDKQSEYQKKFQEKFERSGGYYYEARSFQEFYNWFNQFK